MLVVSGGYMGENGCEYLERHAVEVHQVEGPRDPRLKKLDTGES